jgi:hypothetical protein
MYTGGMVSSVSPIATSGYYVLTGIYSGKGYQAQRRHNESAGKEQE